MSDCHDAREMLERAERAATAGDFASADELLRNAARTQEEAGGPLHPDLATTFNNLAIVAEKTGNPDDAEMFYRRAVAIASASLPPDHPMVVNSRENLESFCRTRGVPIDAPAPLAPMRDTDIAGEAVTAEQPSVAAPAPATMRPASAAGTAEAAPATSAAPRSVPHRSLPVVSEPIPADPRPARGSHSIAWVAIAILVLLATTLFMLRPWSSHNTSTPAQAEGVPPPRVAPAGGPVTTEPAVPPKTEPGRDNRGGAASQPAAAAAGAVTLVAAELCRSFSTSARNWHCERAADSVAPGPIVLYTRIRSERSATVVHRWYHGGTLAQAVTLAIGANAAEGYRTYSRQTVKAGDWRVEVRNADGKLLHEQQFSVR